MHKCKISWLMMVILLVGICVTACGGEKTTASFDETVLQADALAVCDAMQQGNYDEIVAKFDETMAKALDAKGLEDAYVATVAQVGDYEKRGNLVAGVQEGYYVVVVTEEYSLQNIDMRVVYDQEGKIAGLMMTFAQKTATNEPVETNNYEEVEVTIAADASMPLDGFLTLPKNVAQPPVVILVHGSGSSDRNETISANAPFCDIAHGLAERGIATLRYDKRYFAYPENGAQLGAELTLREEVLDDVQAAVAFLQNSDAVDSERIFVLGHSLGGMLTPAIAYENDGLAGIISMAGSLRPLYEIVYDQNQEVIAAYRNAELSDDVKQTLDQQIAQIEREIEILRGDYSALKNDEILLGIPMGYWKSLREYEGMNFIEEMTLPILVLQGSADFQVYADKDYVLWQQTLQGRDNAQCILYEGLNHLLMPAQGKRDVSEYAVKNAVDAAVLDDICAFVEKYERKFYQDIDK